MFDALEDREDVIKELIEVTETEKDLLRRAILEYRRVDLLATKVLGYKVKPLHLKMQRHVVKNDRTLTLVFRGAGKTTTITVTNVIYNIIINPDVRVLIASKTHTFAKGILSEIKGHFEKNQTLIELFGPFESEQWSWGKEALSVAKRTRIGKEPTINTLGLESQVIGWHYDRIYADDLVDDKNARTAMMREKTHTFYYKHLYPTLEPDGAMHVIGTRYHYEDLYKHLEQHEMEDSTLVIPILNEEGQTPWPEKFTPEQVHKTKEAMGLAIFTTQMLCNAEALKGEIFDIDYMPLCERDDVPADGSTFVGVDVSTGEGGDYFAIVAIVVKGSSFWVIDSWTGKLRFTRQAAKIKQWWDKHKPDKIAIEINGYQKVISQVMEENHPEVLVKKIHTKEDKATRGRRVAARLEEGKGKFLRGNEALTSQLVALPTGDNDDLFDALDHAITAALGRRKKRRGRRRRSESETGSEGKRDISFGLIGPRS